MNTLNIKQSSIAFTLASIMVFSPLSYASNYDQSLNDIPLLSKQKRIDNENIGFGTGALIGGIVAGPIGAIITGVVGIVTAKNYNNVIQAERLTAKLEQEQNSHQTAIQHYHHKLVEAEQAYQQELLALQQAQEQTNQLQAENLLMSLQFSTGSSELQPHYHEQISAVANMLLLSPALSIDLSGYTDMKGSDELNQALSLARVNSVKKALISQGINAERINLYAFGEKVPVVANQQQEESFYDRRVVIKLQNNQNSTQTVNNH